MSNRTFDGKTYKEDTHTTTKTNAEYLKKQRQKAGFSVRVVKSRNGYTLYSRKK